MYTTYANELDDDGLLYEPQERTSDIQFAPAMNTMLLAAWLVICAIGFGIIFLAKNPIAGAAVIAIPTFVGMVIKPTFALCILMLVLPTGAGVGLQEAFSLDRAVGLAVALGFFLNVLLTRPGLRVRHKALWVAAGLSVWIGVSSLIQPHLTEELPRAFTQFQLVLLILIVYWILETNNENTFRWALRCYIVGMVGSVAVAMKSGQAIRAVQETRDVRYSATLGQAIDANMLSALIAIAFLSAIYLFARDRSLFWRRRGEQPAPLVIPQPDARPDRAADGGPDRGDGGTGGGRGPGRGCHRTARAGDAADPEREARRRRTTGLGRRP